MNLHLDDFDDVYVEEASTATYPTRGHKVAISSLVIERDGTCVLGEGDVDVDELGFRLRRQVNHLL